MVYLEEIKEELTWSYNAIDFQAAPRSTAAKPEDNYILYNLITSSPFPFVQHFHHSFVFILKVISVGHRFNRL